MHFAFLEKTASRETGRRPVSSTISTPGRLIVYPIALIGGQFLCGGDGDKSVENFYLEYGSRDNGIIARLRQFIGFAMNLIKLLVICSRVDIYVYATKAEWSYLLLTMLVSRLLGISVFFHDYRFRTGYAQRLFRISHSISYRVEMGDISAIKNDGTGLSSLCFRLDLVDLKPYRKMKKEKAVPRVLVYGDYEDRKVLSLLRRTHALIKQKYPRTEFILMSFICDYEDHISPGMFDGSVRTAVFDSEKGLENVFDESDILMLISPGGLNRLMMVRARASGYPIIVNGIDCDFGISNIIYNNRNSFSGLAEAVIRLVDDDSYYRSFAISRETGRS